MSSKRLGLDVSFAHLGMIIIQDMHVIDYHTIHTEPDKKKTSVAADDVRRTLELVNGLVDMWKRHRYDRIEDGQRVMSDPITQACVELPTGGAQGARANRGMGIATGIVVAVLSCLDIPVTWVTPSEVKLAAAGHRNAEKVDVEGAVLEILHWDVPPAKTKKDREHVCDAAGAVLAALLKHHNIESNKSRELGPGGGVAA